MSMQPDQRAAQLQQERQVGEQAKSLADHPYLNKVLDELEAAYIDKWKNDTALSAAGREALWNAMQGAVQFRQHLRAHISSGEVARAAIDKMVRTARA